MLFFLQIKFLFILCQKNTKTLFHFTTGVKNQRSPSTLLRTKLKVKVG